MEKISSYDLPRTRVYITAIAIGGIFGIVNTTLDLDFTPKAGLFLQLVIAIVSVVVLHEGAHGLLAVFFGHKPIFGIKPPLVYITFADKIPRGQFIAISLAPLVFLDFIFGLMYLSGVLKLFFNFCITINTLGATGDVWITAKLIGVDRGTFIQDTKTGVEVWRA